MTPKEKAIELVEKFKNRSIELGETHSQLMAEVNALIAVDELINCTPSVDIYPFNYQKIQPKVKEYWKEVKQEIELL